MPRSPSHYKNWGNLEIELEKEKRQRYHVYKNKQKKLGEDVPEFDEILWHEYCPIFPGIKLTYFSEGKKESSPSILRTDKPGWAAEVVSWKAAKIIRSGTTLEIQMVLDYLTDS